MDMDMDMDMDTDMDMDIMDMDMDMDMDMALSTTPPTRDGASAAPGARAPAAAKSSAPPVSWR